MNPNPRLGIPATCYRTENAQIPQSAGESAGKSARKKGTAGGTAGSSAVSLLFQRKGPPSTAPSSPPSSPLFPGTLPGTLPGTFGDLGVLSPVAGRWDSNPRPMPPSHRVSRRSTLSRTVFARSHALIGGPHSQSLAVKKFVSSLVENVEDFS